MGVAMMANKITLFTAMPLDSKHTDTNFSPNSTDLLRLQLAQVLISPDLAVFVSMTTATELIALPLARAHGVIGIHPLWMTFNKCPGDQR